MQALVSLATAGTSNQACTDLKGFVPSTSLFRDNPRPARLAMSWIIHYLPFAKSQTQAGEVIAALAIAPEYSSFDNAYITASLQQEKMHDSAYDEAYCEAIWNWSLERTSQ